MIQTQLQVDTGPAHRLRPAGEAARAPAGPPAAAPRARQDGRLGLPARCRRALRRRPRHRRRLPADGGGAQPRRHVRHPGLPRPDARAAVARGRAVPLSVSSLLLADDDRSRRAGEGTGVHADRAGVRDSVLGRRGQELRPRAPRARAVLAVRRRGDARAAQPHVAGVAVLGGGDRGDAGGHGARADRGRAARPRRPADGGRPAGGHRLPGRGLQPDFRDRPYDRLAAAGHRQRPPGPRDLRADPRDARRRPMRSTRRPSPAMCASNR